MRFTEENYQALIDECCKDVDFKKWYDVAQDKHKARISKMLKRNKSRNLGLIRRKMGC